MNLAEAEGDLPDRSLVFWDPNKEHIDLSTFLAWGEPQSGIEHSPLTEKRRYETTTDQP